MKIYTKTFPKLKITAEKPSSRYLQCPQTCKECHRYSEALTLTWPTRFQACQQRCHSDRCGQVHVKKQ